MGAPWSSGAWARAPMAPLLIRHWFSVSSSEPNGWATDISILKLYRRCFHTWPLLATSGHSLYAKSASIYLSSTANLPNDNRVVHQHFVEGLHVAKRSDRAWAGLSTDLMIEQVLNAQHEYKWSSDQRQRNDQTAASHVVTCYAGMRWDK